MALSLAQIRDFVRSHLDLEEEDLPNEVLDVFVREGSKRIERAEPRWPFYEATYQLNTVAGTRTYPTSAISSELDQVAAVSGEDWDLQWVGMDLYGRLNPTGSATQSRPVQFAVWGESLNLHPTPDQAYALTVRGYRRSADWVAGGAGEVPDLPDELHNTVALWALAKAYAQQEDPELSAVYERQFNDELSEYRRRFAQTPHPQPIILNGQSMRSHSLFGRLRFPFEA